MRNSPTINSVGRLSTSRPIDISVSCSSASLDRNWNRDHYGSRSSHHSFCTSMISLAPWGNSLFHILWWISDCLSYSSCSETCIFRQWYWASCMGSSCTRSRNWFQPLTIWDIASSAMHTSCFLVGSLCSESFWFLLPSDHASKLDSLSRVHSSYHRAQLMHNWLSTLVLDRSITIARADG